MSNDLQLREGVVFVDLEAGGVSVKISDLKTDALLYEAADMIEELSAKLNEAMGQEMIRPMSDEERKASQDRDEVNKWRKCVRCGNASKDTWCGFCLEEE